MGGETLVRLAERMPWAVAAMLAIALLFIVLALSAQANARRSATVVIVDDDEDVRRALKAVLSPTPLQVIGEAHDGAAGCTVVETLRPDIVVMDVRMPNIDGIEAARRIKAVMPGVRIVGFSSTDDDPTGAIMRRAGASAHLVKGDDPETIVRTLQDLA